MNRNREFLASLLKTAQLSQAEIRSALACVMAPTLRKALEAQLSEYHTIEIQSHALATQRGWELPELSPGRRFLAARMTRLRLPRNSTDSRIAGMVIRRSTQGATAGFLAQAQWDRMDSRVKLLSQKLLDCENASIRQMQQFL